MSVFVQLTKKKKKKWYQVHLQVLRSATPQRGSFQALSQIQALLGALVFPKNFSS
jgi:hypothetical protein